MIVWRPASNPLFIGLLGFLGKYQVFSISEDTRKRSSQGKSLYKLQYTLPGLVNTLYGFESIENATDEAESIFKHWRKQAGLDPYEESKPAKAVKTRKTKGKDKT